MNPILEEILETGLVTTPQGNKIKLHSNVGEGSGRVLQAAIEVAKPRLACEVGLAYGISTLYILDAMQQHGGGTLIGMDPAQRDSTWQGTGLQNVERAGFSKHYKFYEETSQRVLPRLAEGGTRIQFAFIDGWHTFDHTLVDFFYVDQVLDVGGVVVLDDIGYPGLQRLAHFIVTNRDYEILDYDPLPYPISWKTKLKRSLQNMLHPLVRDNFTPSAQSTTLKREVDKGQLIALRKKGVDKRSFDHFIPF
ncbi:MAG: class I SAM-dependent methyltransferase [Gammaproteobacteria bacterium]|nr:class I SAM-dependent methyltransferase [Gammaproteobacteria bacterium]MDH5693532.1 class I SAM-dependent methyltransferase [Gammaproteobacteria bacterium]